MQNSEQTLILPPLIFENYFYFYGILLEEFQKKTHHKVKRKISNENFRKKRVVVKVLI